VTSYYGTAQSHPTLVGNGIFAEAPSLVGGTQLPDNRSSTTSQLSDEGTNGAGALAFYGQDTTLNSSPTDTSVTALSPFTSLTGIPTTDVAAYDGALIYSPASLLLSGNSLLETLPWSSEFFHGQGRW
jgi:hypothetical protein